jgi:hypothetical protein
MNTISNISFISFFLIIGTITSIAQTDSSLVKEVEVVKAYMPAISNAQKISSNPQISDTTSYTPTFDYRIFSSDIPVDKNISHLPVVKLGSLPRNSSNTGHARAGFGNALTPYGALLINTSPTRNTDFGMHLFHFYSKPTVTLNNEKKVKTPYSKNMARIFVKNNFRRAVLEWDIEYRRYRHNYYGFPENDSAFYVQELENSNILNSMQAFNNASAKATIRNTNSRANLDYKIDFGYNFLWNVTEQTSHQANYNGLFIRRYRSHHLYIDTGFEYFNDDNINHNFDSSLTNHQYYQAKLSPGVLIKKNNIELYAGFNLASLINADSVLMWHISPKINFEYHPLDGALTLFAGIDGGFSPNNYQQAFNNNQYFNYMLDLKPSEEVISFKGGLKGKLSSNFSYMFDVDYSINQNEAFYYLSKDESLSRVSANNLFDVDYEDLNLLKFGGNLRYSSRNVTVDLRGNYFIYDFDNLSILSHKPDFEASLSTMVNITNKITAKADANLIGPRQALYKVFNAVSTREETHELNAIININIGADYAYTDKLDFFINANNILNKNHQYWHGYNSPGLLIMLGGRYTF